MARHEIVLFLQLVREAYEARQLNYRRARDKNRETLEALGWQPRDMFECVADLKSEQALCSPRQNRHPDYLRELVCEFGTKAQGHDIYVKVTVVVHDKGVAGCVISFHFAEKPLEFPFD